MGLVGVAITGVGATEVVTGREGYEVAVAEGRGGWMVAEGGGARKYPS